MSHWPHTAKDLIDFFLILFLVLIPLVVCFGAINNMVINL